ncbi:S66 family peptidase [Frigoribacterium salinisoli]
MAGIRYPRPLVRGARVEVPAPSSGVPEALHARLDRAVADLRGRGFDVRVGDLARRGGLVPGTVEERLDELHAAFAARPGAVLPPWGGDLAVELVDRLDWAALAEAGAWFVGWSDLSTLTLPLTVTTGLATLHGANLLDEPWELPEEFVRWTDVAALAEGASFTQRAAPRRRSRPWGEWSDEPLSRGTAYEEPTRWRTLDGRAEVRASGRLLGGCLETVSLLAGSRFGDVPGFARRHAPEGLVLHLEVAGADAATALRLWTSLRLAGWFDAATAVLVGRTTAPDVDGLTQDEAVERALGGLGVPVVLDVDTGHQPPQLPLVDGALAEVRLDAEGGSITQRLVP